VVVYTNKQRAMFAIFGVSSKKKGHSSFAGAERMGMDVETGRFGR
jgi:hypothetical protein